MSSNQKNSANPNTEQQQLDTALRQISKLLAEIAAQELTITELRNRIRQLEVLQKEWVNGHKF